MLDLSKGVEAAKAAAGGGANLARLLGIRRQTVYQWDRVPAERVITIEQGTGLPRSIMRPDIYPQEQSEGA